jgi:hypothetical protein
MSQRYSSYGYENVATYFRFFGCATIAWDILFFALSLATHHRLGPAKTCPVPLQLRQVSPQLVLVCALVENGPPLFSHLPAAPWVSACV